MRLINRALIASTAIVSDGTKSEKNLRIVSCGTNGKMSLSEIALATVRAKNERRRADNADY